jgi:hypothetical protein
MWLWRRQQEDPRFPRPLIIAGRRFYDVVELDMYDELMRRGDSQPEHAA